MALSKKSKKDQPKRRRYIADGRMVKNAVKNLERHMKLYSPGGEDATATVVLARLRGGGK